MDLSLVLLYVKLKFNPFQIGDIVAPSIILAQGIGRWGNFMNHEGSWGPVSRTFLENLHIPEFIIRNMYIEGYTTIQHSYMNLYGIYWDSSY